MKNQRWELESKEDRAMPAHRLGNTNKSGHWQQVQCGVVGRASTRSNILPRTTAKHNYTGYGVSISESLKPVPNLRVEVSKEVMAAYLWASMGD